MGLITTGNEVRHEVELLYVGIALFLLLNLAAGLIRVARGPTESDRMMAAQLFGTNAVAILLVFAELSGMAPLRDVALVFALLAAVTAIAYNRYGAGNAE